MEKSFLIGISGKSKSGKSTAADIISKHTSGHQKAFADLLKKHIAELLGVDRDWLDKQEFKERVLNNCWLCDTYINEHGEKIKFPFNTNIEQNFAKKLSLTKIGNEALTVREILQKVGDGMRNLVHPDYWVNGLFSTYEPKFNWIVTDVRYPNEYKRVKDLGGFIIRIEREGIQTMNHPSETSLDIYKFDYTIHNNSTLDFLENCLVGILTTESIIAKPVQDKINDLTIKESGTEEINYRTAL